MVALDYAPQTWPNGESCATFAFSYARSDQVGAIEPSTFAYPDAARPKLLPRAAPSSG